MYVFYSWNEIPSESVMRSFLKCGISNSIDGTQDDELFSEFIGGREEEVCEERNDDVGMYDDALSDDQFQMLYGESDNEEFESF